jgi:PBP1b-binding outer membrane lipoprotein LpoB
MKKIMFVLILLFFLSACSAGYSSPSKAIQPSSNKPNNTNTQIEMEHTEEEDCNEANAMDPCSPLFLSPANPMINVNF